MESQNPAVEKSLVKTWKKLIIHHEQASWSHENFLNNFTTSTEASFATFSARSSSILFFLEFILFL